jgi:hypothetical protein
VIGLDDLKLARSEEICKYTAAQTTPEKSIASRQKCTRHARKTKLFGKNGTARNKMRIESAILRC